MPFTPPKHKPFSLGSPNKDAKKLLDIKRGSASKRGYNYAWQKIRKAALARQPLCQCDDCKRKGEIVLADVVDHIDGNTSNNDPSNLRPMFKKHHDRHTARTQGFARKRDKTTL